MKKSTRSQLITLGATAVASSFLTVFVKSFISGEKKIKKEIPRRYGIDCGQFERSMSQLLGPPILAGNTIQRLENGVEIFPAMLAGIARARETICFETYIYWQGETADQFSKALSEKAREGVRVHVLIDGVGCDCVEGGTPASDAGRWGRGGGLSPALAESDQRKPAHPPQAAGD